MQKEGIEYTEIKPQIDATRAAVKQLKTTPGPFFKNVYEMLPKEPDGSGYSTFLSHEIKDNAKEREKFQESPDAFVEALSHHLEVTFPDSHLMEAFHIFKPCAAAHETRTFEMLEDFLSRYSKMVNPHGAHSEWLAVMEVMKQEKFQGLNKAGFFNSFLHINRNVYPNLTLLAAIGLTTPITSVNCERGVSRYSSIKTDSRSNLLVSNVDTVMMIFLESKPLEQFNFSRAFEVWNSEQGTSRKGFSAMVKTATKKAKLTSHETQNVGSNIDCPSGSY